MPVSCYIAGLKFQLYDMGMDYTKISDFTLFSNLLAPSCCQSETSIITGELDLTKYELAKNEGSEEIVMYDFLFGFCPVIFCVVLTGTNPITYICSRKNACKPAF